MYDNPMTSQQIADLMDFQLRQSDYYFNAGKYIGLFEKKTDDHQVVVQLTTLGNRVFKLNYKERQLKLVSLILEHQIFANLFDTVIENGELPDIDDIAKKMRELRVCNEPQVMRRASSVSCWLRWIFNLTKL